MLATRPTSAARAAPAARRLAPFVAALLAAACATAPTAPATTPRAPRDVLFVGNSFSFYGNGLHNHYRRLRQDLPDAPQNGRTRLLALSGGHLYEQLAGLRARLAAEPWHVVVLQPHSLDAVEPRFQAAFRAALHTAVADVRRAGATPVLLMTWAYRDRPEMSQQLDDTFTQLGQELGADVLPVGRAFARCRTEHPQLVLHMPDGRHPTMAGTYLAACVVLAALHGAPADDVELSTARRWAGVDAATARTLQAVAWRTVTERAGDR